MERQPKRMSPAEELAAAEAWRLQHEAELAEVESESVDAEVVGGTTDLDPTTSRDIATYIRITDDSEAILKNLGVETEL